MTCEILPGEIHAAIHVVWTVAILVARHTGPAVRVAERSPLREQAVHVRLALDAESMVDIANETVAHALHM